MRRVGVVAATTAPDDAEGKSGVLQEVTMADTLRSEGKIYVVVVIMLVIFAGIVAYLFSIDRKVTRLEKRIQDKK